MDFELNKGFRADGTRASLDLALQPDEVVLAALSEARAVAQQRQLIAPEAGSVATTTAAEAAPDFRERLLGTVAEGAKMYRAVVENINASRKVKNRIPVLTDEEYQTAAESWLTPERLAAAAELPQTQEKPLLIIPKLNRPISHEEILTAYESAADSGLYKWGGQLDFLKKFPVDKLSGYDAAEEGQAFVIVPTAYDQRREGTVREQNARLNKLRASHPTIEVAPILYGAVVAERYKAQARRWQDSYVRDISLEPQRLYGRGFVVDANVCDDGKAGVDGSLLGRDFAARLLVG